MKVLDLVLKSQWYLLIELGIKKEEYREIKPYWEKRLALYDNRYCLIGLNPFGYTHVRFRRGYTKTTMLWELKRIVIGKGREEWGYEPPKEVFILCLGKRVE